MADMPTKYRDEIEVKKSSSILIIITLLITQLSIIIINWGVINFVLRSLCINVYNLNLYLNLPLSFR